MTNDQKLQSESDKFTSNSGRLLGIDYGTIRIGVAMSDPGGLLASPLITLKNNRRVVFRIAELAKEHQVKSIIVGYPLNLKGLSGVMAEEVDKFIGKLERQGIAIVKWDERFSSISAANLLRQAGVNLRGDKGRIDRSAAAIILQNYLDFTKNRN